jgi:hypothetical protein
LEIKKAKLGVHVYLPKAFPEQDLDISALGNCAPKNYSLFTRLLHGTHLLEANDILRSGQLTPFPVKDTSCFNDEDCVWLGPNSSTNTRYGAFVFQFSLALLKEQEDLKFYWVEVVEYSKSEAASRVLVTSNHLDTKEFKEFNPLHRGGPLWIDDKGSWYALNKCTARFGGGSIR